MFFVLLLLYIHIYFQIIFQAFDNIQSTLIFPQLIQFQGLQKFTSWYFERSPAINWPVSGPAVPAVLCLAAVNNVLTTVYGAVQFSAVQDIAVQDIAVQDIAV